MISGSYPNYRNSSTKSVEVFLPSTGQHCELPDLPDSRYEHTMDSKTVCGGSYYSETTHLPHSDCLTLTADWTWERTTTMLNTREGGNGEAGRG